MSVRHIRRLLARYREEGPKALAHGNRGRKPSHTLDGDTRVRIIELAQRKYAGFNHVHLTEKLEGEGIYVSRSCVRRVLLVSGIRTPRKRRPPKHRRRRERRPQQGMMLQIDGSRHDPACAEHADRQGDGVTQEEPAHTEAEAEVGVVEKRAGTRAVHFSTKAPKPAANHPWRTPSRQSMVTKSLNN